MSKIDYFGGYTLSQLRNFLTCDGLVGGYTTASSMRGAFYGAGSTGNMAFATNSWINSRCWTLNVYSGAGYVANDTFGTGWVYDAIYPPQAYAVSSNQASWVTINATGAANYSFSYWMRTDPFEVWSYSANVSYYVPTDGWQGTYRLGAAFSYDPPPVDCYTYELYEWSSYGGVDCQGNYSEGYNYYRTNMCFRYLDYGGFQLGSCDPNCLVKGTLIEMADGTQKLIEKIRVGDVLKGIKIDTAPEDDTIIGWSTDTLNLIETQVRVIGIVPVSTKKTYTFNNGLLESSPEHAHFIKRGNDWLFKKAESVIVGDFLVDKQGNSIEITSIDIYDYIEQTETAPGNPRKIVYDMNVETTDTYIANGLITHNPPVKEIIQ